MALRVLSWNIRTLGDRSGKQMDSINAVAAIHDFLLRLSFQQVKIDAAGTMDQILDVLLVMEVSKAEAGAKQVADLADRMGWGWFVTGHSTATFGASTADRYAILWNPRTVDLDAVGLPFAGPGGVDVVFPDRRPAGFTVFEKATKKRLNLLVIHGPNPDPKGPGNPAYDTVGLVAALDVVAHPPLPVLVCGDWNVDYNLYAAAYNPFTALGMPPLFAGVRTSIYPGVNYLVSAYDNIMVAGASVFDRGCEDFVAPYAAAKATALGHALTADEWRALVSEIYPRMSDHLPVWAVVGL